MRIAADICIYTNGNITLEELDTNKEMGGKVRKTGLKRQV
jgi:hypothetical protein